MADSALVKHPLSEYRSGGDGFVKVVLGDGAYTWQFVNSRYLAHHRSGERHLPLIKGAS